MREPFLGALSIHHTVFL